MPGYIVLFLLFVAIALTFLAIDTLILRINFSDLRPNTFKQLTLFNTLFSFVLTASLWASLAFYGFIVNLAFCLLFCNTVGDPKWTWIWLVWVWILTFGMSSLYFPLRSRWIDRKWLSTPPTQMFLGAITLSILNSGLWLIIATFKLLSIFDSYYGPA